jgi:predicted porin
MKKTLLTIFTLLSLTANAEDLLDYNFRTAQNGQWTKGNAQIYGKAAIYSEVDKINVGQSSLKDSESSLGFIVGEDLGGGLRVRARVETGLLMVDGTTKSPGTVGSFESRVGIGNDNFSYDMGHGRHEFGFTITRNDPFAGNRGTLTPLIHNNRALRLSNAMFVKTRTDEGTELALDYGLSDSTDYRTKPMVHALTASQFFSDKGRMGVSYYDDEINRATSLVFGASYQFFDKIKLYTVLSDNRDNAKRTNGNSVSSKVNVTYNLDLLSSYGYTTRSGLSSVSALSNTFRYNFSKRTFFDINYTNVNTNDTTIVKHQTVFGLAHIF